jgi:hypothetical protein
MIPPPWIVVSVYRTDSIDAPRGNPVRETPPQSFTSRLNGSASRDQLDDQHYERDHEKDVNESAECVRRDNTKQPQHEKDYKNGPKHRSPPGDSSSTTQALTPDRVRGLFAALFSIQQTAR